MSTITQTLTLAQLREDLERLAAALLQAMASGAIPVTRRLVITRHGQHWEDIL